MAQINSYGNITKIKYTESTKKIKDNIAGKTNKTEEYNPLGEDFGSPGICRIPIGTIAKYAGKGALKLALGPWGTGVITVGSILYERYGNDKSWKDAIISGLLF